MKRNALALVALFALQSAALPQEKPTINITSNNQSGGITAYQVNIGHIDLTFSDDIAAALAKLLPKNLPVEISAVGSARDVEVALSYARYLETAGYTVKPINRIGMLVPPPDAPITVRTAPTLTFLIIAPRA